MGSFAQIGLALATAIGAWINLLLVLAFAVRAGFLELNRSFGQSLLKFALCGAILAAVLWLVARYSTPYFATMRFHDEITLLLLIGATVVLYGALIFGLFGPRWLRGLVKG